MLNTLEGTLAHNPFYVRRLIPRVSFFIGFVTFILTIMMTGSLFPAIAAYLISATLLDQYLFYVKKLKSSDYADAEQLMTENHATLIQLDQYSAKRRNIRLVSLCVGLLVSGVTFFVLPEWLLVAFCVGFMTTTAAGIAFSDIDIKNKYPPFLVKDDRYYNPNAGPRAGFISPAQAGLAAAGLWPWGPVDPSR
jgi:hypothetical protein